MSLYEETMARFGHVQLLERVLVLRVEAAKPCARFVQDRRERVGCRSRRCRTRARRDSPRAEARLRSRMRSRDVANALAIQARHAQ